MFHLSHVSLLLLLCMSYNQAAMELKPEDDMANSESVCGKMYQLITEDPFAAGAFRHLVDKDNPKECRTQNGRTLLHVAATHNNTIAIKELVKHKKMYIDVQDLEGHTPLHDAAVNGSAHAVAWLLKHGANPSTTDSSGLMPRHWADMWCMNPLTCRRIIDILQGAELMQYAKNREHLQSKQS